MADITVYDSEGSVVGDGSGRAGDKIRNYFYDSVRLAVETGRSVSYYLFFRAKDSRNSRAEQYYAEYVSRESNPSLSQFKSSLEEYVQNKLGKIVDTSGTDMSLYRELSSSESVPGTESDHVVLEDLIRSNRSSIVGVQGVSDAIGLINKFVKDLNSAIIVDSQSSQYRSSADLIVATGSARPGVINPIGSTQQDWEKSKDKVREKVIDKKVGKIQSEVSDLTNEWGLTASEVRERVTKRVPELSAQGTGLASDTTPDSEKLIKSGAAVAAVLGSIAIGIFLLAPGLIPFVGGPPGSVGGEGMQSVEVQINDSVTAGEEVTAVIRATNISNDAKSRKEANITLRNVSSGEIIRSDSIELGNGTEKYNFTLKNHTTEVSINVSVGNSTDSSRFTVFPGPPAGVKFKGIPQSGSVGEYNITVVVIDEFGNVVDNPDVNVTLSSSRQIFNSSNSSTKTVDGSSGEVVFNTVLAETGTVSLNVSSPGLMSDTTLLNLTSGQGVGVSFTSDIQNISTENDTIQVSVIDKFGNKVTNTSRNVTVSANKSVFGASDSQTKKISTNNSTVTFDIQLSSPGTTVLNASSPGLQSDNVTVDISSASFNNSYIRVAPAEVASESEVVKYRMNRSMINLTREYSENQFQILIYIKNVENKNLTDQSIVTVNTSVISSKRSSRFSQDPQLNNTLSKGLTVAFLIDGSSRSQFNITIDYVGDESTLAGRDSIELVYKNDSSPSGSLLQSHERDFGPIMRATG